MELEASVADFRPACQATSAGLWCRLSVMSGRAGVALHDADTGHLIRLARLEEAGCGCVLAISAQGDRLAVGALYSCS